MQKQQNKFISNLKLLQGSSLEEYNEYLKQLLLERNISASLEFNLGQFQQCIDQEGNLGPCGLVVYLKQLERQLDELTDDKDLKLYMFQIWKICQ